MKRVYTGFESAGKSYLLAIDARNLIIRNSEWARVLKLPVRPILSNMSFTPEFEEFAKDMEVPIIYWKSLEEIKNFSECDIICDEIGKFFDSRFWEKLSLEIRTWCSEGAKKGIHWYAGAQDFAQVDKSFRRLVQPGDLVQVTKVMGSRRPSATMPPVKKIWGILFLRNLNPQGYSEDKKEFEGSGFPSIKFIHRRYCEIFDTNRRIDSDNRIVLRHVDAYCSDANCSHHKILHV